MRHEMGGMMAWKEIMWENKMTSEVSRGDRWGKGEHGGGRYRVGRG